MNAKAELNDRNDRRDLRKALAAGAGLIVSLAAFVLVLGTTGATPAAATGAPAPATAPMSAENGPQVSNADPGCGCAEACLVMIQ